MDFPWNKPLLGTPLEARHLKDDLKSAPGLCSLRSALGQTAEGRVPTGDPQVTIGFYTKIVQFGWFRDPIGNLHSRHQYTLYTVYIYIYIYIYIYTYLMLRIAEILILEYHVQYKCVWKTMECTYLFRPNRHCQEQERFSDEENTWLWGRNIIWCGKPNSKPTIWG